MARGVTPQLMFEGTAEAAMTLYVSLFANSEIVACEKYKAGEQGAEGSIKLATFTLAGREFRCIDSPIAHDFSFTPALSIFIDCESEQELDQAASALSENGEVLMPADNYGFSQKFTWINDRFGVSWQLNFA